MVCSKDSKALSGLVASGSNAYTAQGRTWSEESCTCGCPLASITGCEAGQEFDYSGSCSCVPAPGHGKVSSKQPGEEMSEGEVVLGWEMVLIISLGSLLIILSTIGDR